ncbi:MAG: hypothetical protein AAF766_17700 [Cyanobacteria bacterium P01_D01_bin.14]
MNRFGFALLGVLLPSVLLGRGGAATAATFVTAIPQQSVDGRLEIPLETLPTKLTQYTTQSGQTLESVTLTLQGLLTSTYTITALPQSPISVVSRVKGSTRLLTPDRDTDPNNDVVLFSSSAITDVRELSDKDLPFSQTFELALPPAEQPDAVRFDADAPIVQDFLIGSEPAAPLPLSLVIDVETSILAASPIDADIETFFEGTLQVVTEAPASSVTSQPSQPSQPLQPPQPPTQPVSVPEPGLVWGLLAFAGGWVRSHRPSPARGR